MNVQKLRLMVVGLGVVLLTSAYYRIHSASIMSDAAIAFLNSLTPEQKTKATYEFKDDERFDWHFIPKPRKGLPLREMTSTQKKLAHALLAAGLSQRGYMKAVSIMSLEDILRTIEKDTTGRRDPDGYFFTVFGEPSEKGTWGYRVEGHHVSQNYTVVNGKVSGSPSFFGDNPQKILDGPRAGFRALAKEEDLGREVIESLNATQKQTAIVDATAYKDIFTMASRKAALAGQPNGLQVSKMNAHQKQLLQDLLDEYCYNMPEQLAQSREEQIKKSGDNLYFAWAGGTEVGQGHYYRIQSPYFLIEFDDTQDHANHIHSVWRDYNGDFGLDLLKQHYETSHR